jgi:prophage regulatory protein
MEQTTKDEAVETLVFLSKQQVLKKIPVTAPTLWAWVRQGKFPRPRAIYNKTVWIASEVDAWMQARPHRQYKPIRSNERVPNNKKASACEGQRPVFDLMNDDDDDA